MKILFSLLVAVLFLPLDLFSQPSLELVWKKNVFPTQIEFAKFSKDGNFIYCAVGNNIQVMDAKTGGFVDSFDNTGITHNISELNISENGEFLITKSKDANVSIWDTQLKKIIFNLKPDSTYPGKETGFETCALSPDGKNAYLAHTALYGIPPSSSKSDVIIFDLHLGKEIQRIAQPNRVEKIQISHDGRFFVTGSTVKNFDNTYNDQLILWDAVTMQQISVLQDSPDDDSFPGYRSIFFSRDDRYLATIRTSYNGPDIYDLNTRKMISTTNGKACIVLDFLPDSTNVIIQQDSTYIKDIKSLRTLKAYYDGDIAGRIIESVKTNDGIIYVFSLGGSCSTCFSLLKFNLISNIIDINEAVKIIINNGNVFINTKVINFENLQITISDLLGNLVYSDHIKNKDQIISIKQQLMAGIYLCKITAGNKEYTQKFEIVR